jgi:hypothetical protein
LNDHEANEDEDKQSWRLTQQKLRKSSEAILGRIREELSIEEEVSNLSLTRVREFDGLFPNMFLFGVYGSAFERPALPSSSYIYCAFLQSESELRCVELTPRNSALNELLVENWELLPSMEPDRLAQFILTMHTIGTTYHEVLANISELDTQSRRDEGFVVSEVGCGLATDSLKTTFVSNSKLATIHALTLYGWMHEKQNLGFTDIQIGIDGKLQFGERQTLCEPVFDKLPAIWY